MTVTIKRVASFWLYSDSYAIDEERVTIDGIDDGKPVTITLPLLGTTIEQWPVGNGRSCLLITAPLGASFMAFGNPAILSAFAALFTPEEEQ